MDVIFRLLMYESTAISSWIHPFGANKWKIQQFFLFLLDTENIDIDITLILDGINGGGGKGWFRIGFLFCIVKGYACKSKEEDLIKIWDFVKLGIIISTSLESLKIVHEFLTSWVPLNVHFSSTVALILSGLTKLVWTGIQIRDPNPYPDKTRLLTKP